VALVKPYESSGSNKLKLYNEFSLYFIALSYLRFAGYETDLSKRVNAEKLSMLLVAQALVLNFCLFFASPISSLATIIRRRMRVKKHAEVAGRYSTNVPTSPMHKSTNSWTNQPMLKEVIREVNAKQKKKKSKRKV